MTALSTWLKTWHCCEVREGLGWCVLNDKPPHLSGYEDHGASKARCFARNIFQNLFNDSLNLQRIHFLPCGHQGCLHWHQHQGCFGQGWQGTNKLRMIFLKCSNIRAAGAETCPFSVKNDKSQRGRMRNVWCTPCTAMNANVSQLSGSCRQRCDCHLSKHVKTISKYDMTTSMGASELRLLGWSSCLALSSRSWHCYVLWIVYFASSGA